MSSKMNKKRDLFEDIELYDEVTEIIPFSMGAPGPVALSECNAIMMEATAKALEDRSEDRYIFQYGPRQGDPKFRENLANFLCKEYEDSKISSDDLFVTAGATQGLHLVTTVMFDKDIPIFVEDPSYFIAIKILTKDLGMKVIPVSTDGGGIITEEFERLLLKERQENGVAENKKSPFTAMLYTMPTIHNPLGCSLSPERCKHLIRLARTYDILLFTEDVYNILYYHGKPPKRLLSYDERDDPQYKGNVLSNCTFSKILAPGMRLGWIEAGERIIKIVTESNVTWSGGCFNHYTSRLVSTALQMGLLSQHLKTLRKLYGDKMKFACDSLKKNLPETVKINPPDGGFFIWITFPETFDCAALAKLCASKYGLNFILGTSSSPTGSFKNCIRLSISYCEMNELKVGLDKLHAAINEQMKSTSAS